MIIGVDFDNTIVCYDSLFHRIAVERGLIPPTVAPQKKAVRDALRERGHERQWTELQGAVYGSRMAEAQPFPGVKDFFRLARQHGDATHIISHKTRHAVVGPAFDLHQSAREWLTAQGFFDSSQIGLSPESLHFGLTRQEKLRIIREVGCTVFIDDLEETFLERDFPDSVEKILFAQSAPDEASGIILAPSWAEIQNHVFRNNN
jgi:hypothetical protein